MNNAQNTLIQIDARDGVAVVSSRDVAEKFGKRHIDVMTRIEGKDRPGCKRELGLLDQLGNPTHPFFVRNTYTNPQNQQSYAEYLMTRDGFSLLVMGFTGKAALEWKLKYIEAFNRMEEEIRSNPFRLPRNYKEALLAIYEKVEENEQLAALNAELFPKAEYHDTVLRKPGLIAASTIAKDLGLPSATQLNQILHRNRIIYRDASGVWKPYANYERLITDDFADYQSYDNPGAPPVLKWTEKGRQWIADNIEVWKSAVGAR